MSNAQETTAKTTAILDMVIDEVRRVAVENPSVKLMQVQEGGALLIPSEMFVSVQINRQRYAFTNYWGDWDFYVVSGKGAIYDGTGRRASVHEGQEFDGMMTKFHEAVASEGALWVDEMNKSISRDREA